MSNNRFSILVQNSGLFKALILTAVVFLTYGCVALQPFPTAARAGDTITLAVGSADGMTSSNTTVEFFENGVDPDTGPGTTIPIRSVMKLMPDKTSFTWLGGGAESMARRSSHGAWLSILVIDLPETLPEGDGIIRVSPTISSTLGDGGVTYPRLSATPNGQDIPVKILAGTGSPNQFGYSALDGTTTSPGNLGELESLPHAIIKPEVLTEGNENSESYGAIEFDVTVPIINLYPGGGVLDEDIAVILDDQPQNINNQTNLIWKRTGDNFNIMLVSPVGMYSYEARVSIVPKIKSSRINEIPEGATLGMNSVTYYDLNGVVDTSAPSATISIGP